ncbi:Hypothetical protein I596_3446 [Dokdonella koreensis DS-123]|uniref:Uncharacterized protein n=1 Tax=Dokdonella koreensis DS-123 TaxID=1300342 RepID=A0A160DXY4_9GAMM|nr:Hypothetical protein I596_3446 [Dokdonella koreensis DS-123]
MARRRAHGFALRRIQRVQQVGNIHPSRLGGPPWAAPTFGGHAGLRGKRRRYAG